MEPGTTTPAVPPNPTPTPAATSPTSSTSTASSATPIGPTPLLPAKAPVTPPPKQVWYKKPANLAIVLLACALAFLCWVADREKVTRVFVEKAMNEMLQEAGEKCLSMIEDGVVECDKSGEHILATSAPADPPKPAKATIHPMVRSRPEAKPKERVAAADGACPEGEHCNGAKNSFPISIQWYQRHQREIPLGSKSVTVRRVNGNLPYSCQLMKEENGCDAVLIDAVGPPGKYDETNIIVILSNKEVTEVDSPDLWAVNLK